MSKFGLLISIILTLTSIFARVCFSILVVWPDHSFKVSPRLAGVRPVGNYTTHVGMIHGTRSTMYETNAFGHVQVRRRYLGF